MQPPRSDRADTVLGLFWASFFIAAVIQLPRGMFELHYANWLLWTVRTITTVSLALLVAFLAIRSHEVVGYRRRRASHSGAITQATRGHSWPLLTRSTDQDH